MVELVGPRVVVQMEITLEEEAEVVLSAVGGNVSGSYPNLNGGNGGAWYSFFNNRFICYKSWWRRRFGNWYYISGGTSAGGSGGTGGGGAGVVMFLLEMLELAKYWVRWWRWK
jgi:hypothetical protein